ncbi:MAG TPA: peroxiredoxin family protein [Chloroflexota bacterium]
MRVGVQAPGFTLPSTTGAPLSLEELRGQVVLLVFHHQLGCTPCRQHLLALRQAYHRLQPTGAEVLLVAHVNLPFLRRYVEEMDLPFPALADPELTIYRAYELLRTPRSDRLSLSLWLSRLLGRPSPRSASTLVPRLLAGDFLVDARGTLRRAWRSTEAHEGHPSVEAVVEHMLGLATGKTRQRG